jgi:hypothetical protein
MELMEEVSCLTIQYLKISMDQHFGCMLGIFSLQFAVKSIQLSSIMLPYRDS